METDKYQFSPRPPWRLQFSILECVTARTAILKLP